MVDSQRKVEKLMDRARPAGVSLRARQRVSPAGHEELTFSHG